MNFKDAILTRCSIRKYTGEKITNEQYDELLRYGFAAPSAHNLRPWHFIIVDDEPKVTQLSHVHPYAKMLPDAGGAIIVCGDKKISTNEGFLVQDCAAAIQNILIAANGMGLGGVWIGVYPIDELIGTVSKELDLPDHIIPIGIIAIGHKAGSRQPFDKYDPERIHRNQW